MDLNYLLELAVAQGASDLHLKAGGLPVARIHGKLVPVSEHKLEPDEVGQMASKAMPPAHQSRLKDMQEIDFAYSVPGLGRFRCNVFMQRGTIGMVLRVIPMGVRSVEELGLPAILQKVAAEERGLVLVTGTTGSGKSTTLAAMLDHINRSRSTHIITIEDPIEYLHRDNKSIINQREIGADTRSFASALRSALRQDPDVILVGEMRDVETIETALHAAETGHLVFSTLHTLDATETINRIISVFPPHQQKQIRLQLASVMKAAIAQRLIPNADGTGRLPAVEVLITHRVHQGLHRRQGQDAPDPGRHRPGHVAVRHADVRSVDLQPVQPGQGDAGRSAEVGDQRRRVQAQGAGRLDHRRHVARPDGDVGLRQLDGGQPGQETARRRPAGHYRFGK